MTDLEQFLALPDVETIEEEIFVSNRIGKVKVRAMSSEDFSNYQNKCKIKGSKKFELDTAKLNLCVAAGQIVEPNIADAEFLKKVKCNTATDFVKKKFLIGEITEIASQVQRISGFDADINEEIEEAKN